MISVAHQELILNKEEEKKIVDLQLKVLHREGKDCMKAEKEKKKENSQDQGALLELSKRKKKNKLKVHLQELAADPKEPIDHQ